MATKPCHEFSHVRSFDTQNRAQCPQFVHNWENTTGGLSFRFLIILNSFVFLLLLVLGQAMAMICCKWERNNSQRFVPREGNTQCVQCFDLKLAKPNLTHLGFRFGFMIDKRTNVFAVVKLQKQVSENCKVQKLFVIYCFVLHSGTLNNFGCLSWFCGETCER